MTEKEKMVTKKLYDANYDETLYKERTEAKIYAMIIINFAHRMKKTRESF